MITILAEYLIIILRKRITFFNSSSPRKTLLTNLMNICVIRESSICPMTGLSFP